MSIFKLCAFADEADPAMSGQIKALHENEIELIELRGIDGKNVTELTAAEMRALRTRLDGEGIKVWSIGSPIGKVEIDCDFEKYLELFRHTLELSNIAGAEKMRIFSFFMKPEETAANKNKVIEYLGRMAEIAKGTGVILCHENEKDIYGDIPERCVDIHAALPELRAVYDPANFVQCGADTLKAWEMLKPYIEYMHMKDAGADKVIVPAGKGVGNVPKLLENYAEIGGGVITLEPHLYEFVGLAGLEREGATSVIGNSYNTKREAFDAGVNALKELI